MKRLLRVILWLAALLLVVVTVLFIPAVQKSIFLAVASGPDRAVSVERFKVGPSGISVENLELETPEALARIPQVNVRLSWSALLGRRFVLPEVRMEGVFVKLKGGDQPSDDDATSPPVRLPKEFKGILGQSLPVEIGEMVISGRLATPSNEEVSFSLTAENIAPGKAGRVVWQLEPGESAPVAYPGMQLNLGILTDEAGLLNGLNFDGSVVSRVPDARGELQVKGGIEATENGESYQFALSSEKLFETGDFRLNGEWNKKANEMKLTLEASGEDLRFLQPFVQESLPVIQFAVEVSTGLQPGEAPGSADLQYTFTTAPDLVPQFGRAIFAEGALKISPAENGILLQELKTSVRPIDSEKEWVNLRLLKPQVFSFGDDIQLPLEKFVVMDLFFPSEFLESLADGWRISDFRAGLALSGSEKGFTVEPTEEWTVQVGRDQPKAEKVSLRLSPTFQYDGTAAKMDGVLILSSVGGELRNEVQVSASASDWKKLSFSYQVNGVIAAIKPLVDESTSLPNGKVTGQWEGSYGDELKVGGSLAAKDLQVEGLPKGDFQLTVDELLFQGGETASISTGLDVEWAASGRSSSIKGLRMKAAQSETDRWTLAVTDGTVQIDPLSLQVAESKQVLAEKTSVETKAFDPAVLDFLRHPQPFPLDVDELNLAIELTAEEMPVRLDLSLSHLSAGKEGTVSLIGEVNRAGLESSISVDLSGSIRIDEAGVLERFKGQLLAGGLADMIGLKEAFVDFTIQPGSSIEPFRFEVASGEKGPTLTKGSAIIPDGKAVLTLEADFANWLKTGLRNYFPNLSTGQMKTIVTLDDKNGSVQANIQALTPLDGFESYDVQATLSSPLINPQNLRGSVSVTDAKDKVSDVTFAMEGDLSSKMNVVLAGERVDMKAIQGLARVWKGDPEASNQRTEGEPTDPPWPFEKLPFAIEAQVTFTEVIVPDMTPFNNIDGSILASKDSFITRLSSNWMENSLLSGEGRATFDGSKVNGSIDGKITDLPMGTLLRELQPGQVPSVEGVLASRFSFKGSANSLSKLPDQLVGKITIESRDGVIRSLKPGTRVSRMVQAGSLAGIILADTLKRPGLAALGEVANLFGEIPYDNLQIELQRTADLETGIDKILLRGPYFMMSGSGSVEASDLADIATTPMELTINLGSKPPLTRQLEILGLIGQDGDSDGFRDWKEPIRLTGTFMSPNTTELWNTIIGAVERAATLRSKDLEKEDGSKPATDKPKKKKPEEELIEEGVNRLLNILGA